MWHTAFCNPLPHRTGSSSAAPAAAAEENRTQQQTKNETVAYISVLAAAAVIHPSLWHSDGWNGARQVEGQWVARRNTKSDCHALLEASYQYIRNIVVFLIV